MKFKQIYHPITSINMVNGDVAQLSLGHDGILLAFEAVWWPNGVDSSGFSHEGEVEFHAAAGVGGFELLGTNQASGHRIVLTKTHNYYLWQHPQRNRLHRAVDFWTSLLPFYGTSIGQYQNGINVHTTLRDLTKPCGIVVQAQVLEFT